MPEISVIAIPHTLQHPSILTSSQFDSPSVTKSNKRQAFSGEELGWFELLHEQGIYWMHELENKRLPIAIAGA